jgi:hypothetical protein
MAYETEYIKQCDGYIYDRQCKGEINEHDVIFHYLSSIDDDHMLNTNNPPEQVMICAYHYNKIMTENSGEQPIETWGSEWIKARENLFCNAGYNKEEIIDEAYEASAYEADAEEAYDYIYQKPISASVDDKQSTHSFVS